MMFGYTYTYIYIMITIAKLIQLTHLWPHIVTLCVCVCVCVCTFTFIRWGKRGIYQKSRMVDKNHSLLLILKLHNLK